MSRVLITGSTDGIGRGAALALLEDGHEVVTHARTQRRLADVQDLMARGARSVVGDLASLDQVLEIAEQAKSIGDISAVIHNAGIIGGTSLIPVNVVAPYVLTAALPGPERLIYLSSSMHRSGHADLTHVNWAGSRSSASYSDSKLLVTTLMAAVARIRPSVHVHAVDPGWVPTKMGGPSASDDLALGHVTQAWLATTDEPRALVSGQYWHHQRTAGPHPAVNDERFQGELLTALAEHTGIRMQHN